MMLSRLECVMLNGCQTEPIAEAMLSVAPLVSIICWRPLAEAQAARAFAIGFSSTIAKLRNAEGAFDLLQKFRSMQSQEASQKLMERKTADILLQYEKEVGHVKQLFEEKQEDPPLCKNQPPLAGAGGGCGTAGRR